MPATANHAPPQKYLDALYFDLPKGHDPLHGASKPPLELTYSFDPSAIASLNVGYDNWTPFSSAEEDAVRSALAEYATFLNVSFVEHATGGDVDLSLGRTNIAPDGLGGIHWSSGPGFFDLDGYAIFDTGASLEDAYGRHLILREVGHAMTLKHPGGSGGGDGPFLPARLENNKYSVMSHTPNPDDGGLANHLMLYDIAALQARFGANLHYRTGNDVYTGPDGRLQVIWDAGGTDSIDGSAYGSALTIDLRDGRFSSLGQQDNLAIAFGAVIEGAAGGSGNDKLTGNRWSNALTGGAGDDRLDGGKGADTLTGGLGADAFVFLKAKGGGDAITDFDPSADRILLGKDGFAGIGGKGALGDHKFHVGDGAHDRSDRIVYDDTHGLLIYDKNGSRPGQEKVFAAIDAGLDLDQGMFIVV